MSTHVATSALGGIVVSIPEIASIAKEQAPAIPDGLVYGAAPGPDSLDEAPSCPVLRLGAYTYWPFSFLDNRLAMGIVVYDAAGNQVKRWDRNGARYIWQITLDANARTVTFYGQTVDPTHRPGTITMSWNELWIG